MVGVNRVMMLLVRQISMKMMVVLWWLMVLEVGFVISCVIVKFVKQKVSVILVEVLFILKECVSVGMVGVQRDIEIELIIVMNVLIRFVCCFDMSGWVLVN